MVVFRYFLDPGNILQDYIEGGRQCTKVRYLAKEEFPDVVGLCLPEFVDQLFSSSSEMRKVKNDDTDRTDWY